MIARFFTAVFAKVAAVLGWIGELFVAVFAALWDLLRDAACWPFDQALGLVVTALGAVDVSPISGNLGFFSQIPPGVYEVMSASGAGVCMTIIGSAIVIRLGLQLIPFTRLGS